jgi:hypothetical protein
MLTPKNLLAAGQLTWLLFLALAAAPGIGHASPVRWTLTPNLFLSEGGRMAGAFTYDADTGVYSDVAFLTFGGTYPGGVYRVVEPSQNQDPSHKAYFWASTTGGLLGQREIYVPYIGTLTNAGGSVGVGFVIEGRCVEISQLTGGICLISQDRVGFLNSQLVGTPIVPVPGAAWLFGGALAALGLLKRRRRFL